MNIDPNRLCIEIRRLDWGRDLDEEVVREIANSANLTEFQTGQIVIELDSAVDSVYFVVAGRLEGVIFDRIGKLIQREPFRRGSVVGLLSTVLPDRSCLRVEAAEPTTVIQIRLEDLLQWMAKHRAFQLAVLRVAANLAKNLLLADRELPKPATVAVVHHTEASRPLTLALAQRLKQLGETPSIATDDDRWKPENSIPHRLLFENGASLGPERITELLKEWRSHGRLFVDVGTDRSANDLGRVLSYADKVLWCLRPQDAQAALGMLKEMDHVVPRLREKVCLVWALRTESPAPPPIANLNEYAFRDFKTYSGPLNKPLQGKLIEQGIERIIHFLRGVQIGLALGGGAARGMAHLGVLKALEQHGIFIDMLAGTSAGAMTGGTYGAGMDPAFATQCFKNDLQPSWLFRNLPGGGLWYLVYKYRSGQFDPMLRKYLTNLQMDQLVIPTMMISVDLVDGAMLVRDKGDVTHNILESINLPPLALPIVRSDQAIVDGGLLNNVPADVLLARGCNFVIASSVTSKLEKDFMGVRSKKMRGVSGFTASIQVMMRQNLLQSYSMNALGVEPADVVISPDVSSFGLDEFTRADEMAVAGENAANQSIAQLKAMLAKLDPKLFG
jgi:NTE family protein